MLSFSLKMGLTRSILRCLPKQRRYYIHDDCEDKKINGVNKIIFDKVLEMRHMERDSTEMVVSDKLFAGWDGGVSELEPTPP